jgi:hypothetical protein
LTASNVERDIFHGPAKLTRAEQAPAADRELLGKIAYR